MADLFLRKKYTSENILVGLRSVVGSMTLLEFEIWTFVTCNFTDVYEIASALGLFGYSNGSSRNPYSAETSVHHISTYRF